MRDMSSDREDPRSAGTMFRLGDVFATLLRYKWSVVFTTILGGVGAFFLAANLPIYYSASAALISDVKMSGIIDLQTSNPSSIIDPSATNTVVETIKTPAVLERAIDALPEEVYDDLIKEAGIAEELALLPSQDEAVERSLLLDYLLETLEVNNSGRSYVIYISFMALDPATASSVANVVSNAYFAYRAELKRRAYHLVIDDLDNELASLRLELKSAELRAQTTREERRVLMLRSEALSGPQLDSEIAMSAELYARQRQAEREAEAIADIYERQLRSQRELQSTMASPEISVQLFSPAIKPLTPAGSNLKPIILALGVFAGFLLGASLAMLRSRSRGN